MKRLPILNFKILAIVAFCLISQGFGYAPISEAYASEGREQHGEDPQHAAFNKRLFDGVYDPKIGNPNAKIKVVEFFDYNCTYCYKMFLITKKLAAANPDVQFIFKELPILSKKSAMMSRASLASYRAAPSKYMEYQEALYNARGANMDLATFTRLAGNVGIDENAFKKAFDDIERHDSIVKANNVLANDISIQGTPAYIIGDELIPGYISYEDFNAKISEQRKN